MTSQRIPPCFGKKADVAITSKTSAIKALVVAAVTTLVLPLAVRRMVDHGFSESDAGFIDTWRYFNPDLEGVYSWWSYRFTARQKNAGWRIDYFCVSDSLKDRLVSAAIHTDVLGSDHCPVEVVIGD